VSFYHPRRDSYEPEERPARFRLELAQASVQPVQNSDRRPSDARVVLDAKGWLLQVQGLGVVMIDFEDRVLIFTDDEIQNNPLRLT
jgi:hypothetical protein